MALQSKGPAAQPPPFLPPDEKVRDEFSTQQVKVQGFLFGIFVVYTTILVLGRFRSQGNSFMKTCSTYLFIGAAYLLSYIPGLMNQSNYTNDLYALWFAFIAYLASIANSNSCYTLGDNEDRKKRLVVDYSVAWPLILVSLYKNLASPVIMVPIIVIFLIVVLKLRERSRSLMHATDSSSGLAKTTKIISDFMRYQGKSDGPTYKHLVGVRDAQNLIDKLPKSREKMVLDSKKVDMILKSRKVVTLDKILNCTQKFFTSSEGKELQNTCFSFAMFWLLLAKIAGYDNDDAKINGTNMFQMYNKHNEQQQQQQQPKSNNVEHLFTLVEEELEFLYEYLFTNSYAKYSQGLLRKVRDLCVVVLFLWLTLPLVVLYSPQDYNLIYVLLWGKVLDIGFTRFVILTIIAIELTHMAIFLTSKWAKVIYTCTYVQNEHLVGTTIGNVLEWVLKVICHAPRPKFTCFGNKDILGKKRLPQYTVSTCYDKLPASLWAECWIGSYFELPRVGQDGTEFAYLSLELKEEVVRCIEINGRVFTKGSESLRRNGVNEDIISAHVKHIEHFGRTILIWHIATSNLATEQPSFDEQQQKYFRVATIFSKYCAYLVAFIPQILPNHVYTTQCEFDKVVDELLFKDNEAADDDNDSNSDIEHPIDIFNEEDSTVKRGDELEKYLKKHPDLWKTLAEFWTELLLYLALSDHREANEAHINRLCIGGEFITHLWALLIHEGCSKKN